MISILDVTKIELHNLVKLIHKDKDAGIFSLDTVEICRRLDNLRCYQEEAIEYRSTEEDLVKYAKKLVLSKFNSQMSE